MASTIYLATIELSHFLCLLGGVCVGLLFGVFGTIKYFIEHPVTGIKNLLASMSVDGLRKIQEYTNLYSLARVLEEEERELEQVD